MFSIQLNCMKIYCCEPPPPDHGLIFWRYLYMPNSNRKFYFFIVSLCTPFIDRKNNISHTEEAFKGGLNSSYEAVYEGQLCVV